MNTTIEVVESEGHTEITVRGPDGKLVRGSWNPDDEDAELLISEGDQHLLEAEAAIDRWVDGGSLACNWTDLER